MYDSGNIPFPVARLMMEVIERELERQRRFPPPDYFDTIEEAVAYFEMPPEKP